MAGRQSAIDLPISQTPHTHVRSSGHAYTHTYTPSPGSWSPPPRWQRLCWRCPLCCQSSPAGTDAQGWDTHKQILTHIQVSTDAYTHLWKSNHLPCTFFFFFLHVCPNFTPWHKMTWEGMRECEAVGTLKGDYIGGGCVCLCVALCRSHEIFRVAAVSLHVRSGWTQWPNNNQSTFLLLFFLTFPPYFNPPPPPELLDRFSAVCFYCFSHTHVHKLRVLLFGNSLKD